MLLSHNLFKDIVMGDKIFEGNLRNIIAFVGLIILVCSTLIGLVIYTVDIKDMAEDANTEIDVIMNGGTHKSQENEKTIIGIKKDVVATAKVVDEIRKEQKSIGIDVIYIRAALENGSK
jgi:hypothetical protein